MSQDVAATYIVTRVRPIKRVNLPGEAFPLLKLEGNYRKAI